METKLWLLIVLSLAGTSAYALQTGVIAPDFTLKSASGSNLRLHEFRGDVIVLNFWGSWCGPCAQELPLLQDLHERYESQGLRVIGINLDNDENAARNVLRRLDVEFPTLFDSRKSVSGLYEPDDVPHTYLIDRDGTIRFTFKSYKAGQEKKYEDHIKQLLAE